MAGLYGLRPSLRAPFTLMKGKWRRLKPDSGQSFVAALASWAQGPQGAPDVA